ncbi:MAG TPA: Spy/CpxP family protein refolding chaperone [Methylomirabilota bacterium]|jgi:Spy/CpxP family protein refolding chaperone
MIGLVAGVPLLMPTPAPVPEGRDALDALCRALELSDDQVRAIRKLFDQFARRQATLAVDNVLAENRAVLRHIVTGPTFDRRQAHRIAQQVAAVVARRMENRLKLRHELFRALTPAQRTKYLELVRQESHGGGPTR